MKVLAGGLLTRLLLAIIASLAFLAVAAGPASANGDNVKITLAPQTDTNTVGEQHCVTATVTQVTKKEEKPLEGAVVRFSVSGANSTSGVQITNNQGKAVFCYTGTKAGTDVITAYVDLNKNLQQDSGEPSASATKTYNPGPPASVTVAPATDTNTVGEQHCVTATVRDAYGNVVGSGVPVVFSVTGANPQPQTTKTTDAKGQATFCYTGTKAGEDVITVFVDANKNGKQDVGEPVATATKTYTAALPAGVTVTPPVDTNTVGEQHCVTATVADALGNPVSGASVVFSVTGANPQPQTTKTTDAKGQATFCYTGTKAGEDVITVFVDANKNGKQDVGELVGTAAKTYLPGPAKNVTLEPKAAENVVGTQHCVIGKVTDEFGNPVGAGQKVVFSVSGANPQGPVTKTTDQNGNVVFCYTGKKAGLDTITAFVDANGNGTQDAGELGGTATKLYHAGAPAKVTLEPAAKTNTVGEQHCVTATVTDAFGNPTPGVTVRFSVAGANPTAAPVEKTTNTEGKAEFCYTGTKAGEDVVTAFVDQNGNDALDAGEPAGVATKTYLPGGPAKVELAPETDTNRAGERHCVTATVTDRFGNPVGAGHPIRFSVSGANPTGADVVVATDTEGKATFCYAGTKAGTDTITAFADNNANAVLDEGEPSDTAQKIYRPGPSAKVTLEPVAKTNTVGEQHCVTATVTDAFGNLVEAGTAVFFSVTGANPQPQTTKTTDAKGQATFCYTGTKAGEDVITAVADANENGRADVGEPAGVATKTYKPGPPAKLELTPKTATNTVGEEHCVTATVTDEFGNPTPNVTVVFSVTGAVVTSGDSASVGTGGSVKTNGQGKATFCYTSELPGENVITAFADTNGNGQQDVGEPSDTATKTYVVPVSTPLCEISIRDGGWILTPLGDKGTFGGNAKTDSGGKVVSGSQEYTDHGPVTAIHVKSVEILAVVCEGNRATIYGVAKVDQAVLPYVNGTFPFRVSVMDSGEPGTADSYDILVGNGYYSGEDRPLQGGNIQIRLG